MISPLKLWHHPQPKRLWPVLGGLSVLAHVGVLGLSLPYVLDLMQPAKSAPASESIPIELVADEVLSEDTEPGSRSVTRSNAQSQVEQAPVQEFSTRSTNPSQSVAAESNSAVTARSSEQSSEKSDSLSSLGDSKAEDVSSSDDGDRAQNANNNDDGGNGSSESDSSSTVPADGTTPNEGQPPQPEPSPNPEPPNSGAPNPEPPNPEPANPETPNPEGSGTQDEGSGIEEPSSTDDTEPALPTIPGEDELPVPGEETPDSEVSQSASLSILRFSEAPGQQDLGKTPPRPQEGMVENPIVLSPTAKGCPKIAFSKSQWVYRVAIEADGSVRTATVWTERVGRPMSDEEQAIACLIENAGFAFEPARFDGEPILDDNLLLTIELIEML